MVVLDPVFSVQRVIGDLDGVFARGISVRLVLPVDLVSVNHVQIVDKIGEERYLAFDGPAAVKRQVAPTNGFMVFVAVVRSRDVEVP